MGVKPLTGADSPVAVKLTSRGVLRVLLGVVDAVRSVEPAQLGAMLLLDAEMEGTTSAFSTLVTS